MLHPPSLESLPRQALRNFGCNFFTRKINKNQGVRFEGHFSFWKGKSGMQETIALALVEFQPSGVEPKKT